MSGSRRISLLVQPRGDRFNPVQYHFVAVTSTTHCQGAIVRTLKEKAPEEGQQEQP